MKNFIILFVLLLILLILVGIMVQVRELEAENQMRQAYMDSMEGLYSAIQERIEATRRYRHDLAKNIQTLEMLLLKRNQEIQFYLDELRSRYEELSRTGYCRDWMVDALLCSQERAFSQKGMKLDCRMQGYNRGMIEEKDVVQVLTILLEYAAKASESDGETGENEVILQAARVKNQLVMELNVKEGRKVKFPELKMNPYIRMYSGNVMILHNEKNIRIVVMLKIDELSIKGTDSDQFFNFSKNALTRT